MARTPVDDSQLSALELARRSEAEEKARRRAAAWQARRAASSAAGIPAVALSVDEAAVADGIIQAALAQVAQRSAADQLAALIESQREAIAVAQREYDMPNWYGANPVTLFVLERYERTRFKDNDPQRPRIRKLVDYQTAAVKALAREQIQAVREFQDGVRWNPQNAVGVYQPINRCLRGYDEPDYSQWCTKEAVQQINRNLHLMDTAFNSFDVPEGILAFRGIRGAAAFPRKGSTHAGKFAREFAKWQPGQIRSDNGYVSSTLSRTVADQLFTVGHDDGATEPYVLEYRVPAGTRAISLNALNPSSNYRHTVELLIDRDTQFRVIAKYDDRQDGRVIHRAVLDILPPAQQAGRTKLPVYHVERIVRT